MSVAEVITLPTQPATGTAKFQPMGGDGQVSPKGRYELDISLAQDASGGVWSVAVNLDPQYMNLVAMMQLQENVSGDTTAFSLEIKVSDLASVYRANGHLIDGTQGTASRLWVPPPVIDPLSITFRLLNATDLKIGRCAATIYVFNKGMQHVVPIEQIFRALIRGGSLF